MTGGEPSGTLLAASSWTEELVQACSPILVPAHGSLLYEHRVAGSAPGAFDSVEFGVALGCSLLWAARAQLSAVRQLVVGTSLLPAIAVCSRSCLEASARAWWLFDTQAIRSERIERTLTEGLYSGDEFRKLMNSLQTSIDHPFLADMVASAEAEGLTVLKSDGDAGRPVAVGERRKATTKVVDLMYDRSGVIAWRTGSALAHATAFASMGALAGEILGGEMNETITALFVASALGAFGVAINERNEAFGLPDPDWVELANAAQEDLARRLPFS